MIVFFRVKPNPVDANASFKLLRRRKISNFYSIFSFTPRSKFRLLVLGNSQSKLVSRVKQSVYDCTVRCDGQFPLFECVAIKNTCLYYVTEDNMVYKNLPKPYFTGLLRNDSLGLHQLQTALLASDDSQLHLPKEKKIIKTYAAFFIQDQCCKLLLCLHLMKPN